MAPRVQMPRKQANKVRKRKANDVDQIQENLHPEKAAKLLNQPVDLDLPGDGQYYCIECDRHFVSEETRDLHKKSKLHKQQLKRLREPAYTVKESELAAGVGH